MKKILVFSLAIVGFSSCNKDVHKVTIERDCSGTYVEFKNGLDYKVCNKGVLDAYNAGDKIRITYDKLTECFGLLETCELEHLHEGKIEITSVK